MNWLLNKYQLAVMIFFMMTANGLVLAEDRHVLREHTYNALNEARQDVEKSNYDEAKKKLLALLRHDLKAYDKAVIYQTLGYVENGLGDFRAAAAAFEEAMKQNILPKKVTNELLYNTAQLLIHLEQPRRGLQYLTRWFANSPNPKAEAHIIAASAYYQIKDYRQSIIHVEKALSLSTSPPKSWYELFLAACFEIKEFDKAEKILESLVAQHPDYKDYWLQLAGVYQHLKKEHKALAIYELAYQNALLKNNEIKQLIHTYIYLEMPYKAATVLEKELAIGGIEESRENLILLADSWLLAQERSKAESVFRKIVARFKDNQSRLRLGQLYIETEQWRKAVKLLSVNLASKDEKLLAQMSLLLGIARFNLADYKKASSAFNQALSDKDTKEQARWWLDYMRKKLSTKKQAKPNILQIVRLYKSRLTWRWA